MPRWNFDLAEGLLTKDEKDKLAAAVTKIYVDRNMPGWLINVLFTEHKPGGYYTGGKSPSPAVFFIISHAARKLEPDEVEQFHKEVDAIVRPLFEPKGIKWEYNLYEQSDRHWRVNGMVVPFHNPEVWKQWVTNGPGPY